MIASNSDATSAVRVRSPERVAAWLRLIQASSVGSSSDGQPSQALCARTANGAPSSLTASTTRPASTDATRSRAMARNVGS